MSTPPTLVSIEQDAAAFAGIRSSAPFAEIEAHPQTGAYARLYYPAVHGDACRDVSFAVLIDGRPAAVVLCTLLSGQLCLYGLPLRVFYAAGAASATQVLATRTVMAEIDRLGKVHAVSEVLVRDTAGAALTPLGEACLSRNARADVKVVAEVDLTLGEEGWRKSLRKRYKPLINWGKKNLAIQVVDHGTRDDLAFQRFRDFHLQVAGRVTRPESSWLAMQEWLNAGQSELLLATHESRLVSASYFVEGTTTAIYMTGVYDREQFDKPLAHYVMWLGIERAASRGRTLLELGDIEFRGTVDDKYHQIGYFKRGFATRLASHFIWKWTPKTDGDNE